MLKEYFIALVSISVFLSVALSVSHSKLKGVTVFSIGVLLISAVLLPLVDIVQSLSAEYDIDSILGELEYDGVSDDSIEEAFECGIAEYIAVSYGVESGSVTVQVDGFDMGMLKAQRIYVTLRDDALRLDYKRIEEEIRREFTSGGECEVMLKIG